MSINGNTSLFDEAMGYLHELTEAEIEAEQKIADAQEVLERALIQAERTTFKDDLHMKLVLSSILESWRCVVKARAKIVY